MRENIYIIALPKRQQISAHPDDFGKLVNKRTTFCMIATIPIPLAYGKVGIGIGPPVVYNNP